MLVEGGYTLMAVQRKHELYIWQQFVYIPSSVKALTGLVVSSSSL